MKAFAFLFVLGVVRCDVDDQWDDKSVGVSYQPMKGPQGVEGLNNKVLAGSFHYYIEKGWENDFALHGGTMAAAKAKVADYASESAEAKIPELLQLARDDWYGACGAIIHYARIFLRMWPGIKAELELAITEDRPTKSETVGQLGRLVESSENLIYNLRPKFDTISALVRLRSQVTCRGPVGYSDMIHRGYKSNHKLLTARLNDLKTILDRQIELGTNLIVEPRQDYTSPSEFRFSENAVCAGAMSYLSETGQTGLFQLDSSTLAKAKTNADAFLSERHDSVIPSLVRDTKANWEAACGGILRYAAMYKRLRTQVLEEIERAISERRIPNATVMGKLQLLADKDGGTVTEIRDGIVAVRSAFLDRTWVRCRGPGLFGGAMKRAYQGIYLNIAAHLLNLKNKLDQLVALGV